METNGPVLKLSLNLIDWMFCVTKAKYADEKKVEPTRKWKNNFDTVFFLLNQGLSSDNKYMKGILQMYYCKSKNKDGHFHN